MPQAVRTLEGQDALKIEQDGLAYALDRSPTSGTRVVVSVRVAGSDGPSFIDSAALLAFRARDALATRVAAHLSRDPGQILGHLALLLDQVERAEAVTFGPGPVELTPERRAKAEALLRAPDVLDRAAAAFDGLGHVGEEATKRLAYLIATSRLLARPLSGVLRAPSGAGKSHLLDTLMRLVPPEAVESFSRLTTTGLGSTGEPRLQHKLVLVDEQAEARDANAIRALQTKGFLRLAVSEGGRAERFLGPIALLSATTREVLDPEILSRALELPLDDSPEQTRRIQAAQRRVWAGRAQAQVDSELWQDAQRCLEPLHVVIPFAERLDFPARTTRDRRDQGKLLSVVAAHALLHQHQRERDATGRVLALVADYEAVFRLLTALEHGQDGLSPRAARVHRLLASERAALTRREIADRVGWNYMTSVRALDELMAQELVAVVERRAPRRYEVLGTPSLVAANEGLTAPAALAAAFTPSTRAFTSRGRAGARGSSARSHGFTGRTRRSKAP